MLRFCVRELDGGRLVQMRVEYTDPASWNCRLAEFQMPVDAWNIWLSLLKPSKSYEVIFEE